MISYIGDSWKDQFPEKFPNFPQPPYNPPYVPPHFEFGVPRQEFEALKKEMEELKKLLLAAKAYDKATGQPDCEMDDKVKLIKAVAKAVGVDLGDVFDKA
jgi:hypothetical protein